MGWGAEIMSRTCSSREGPVGVLLGRQQFSTPSQDSTPAACKELWMLPPSRTLLLLLIGDFYMEGVKVTEKDCMARVPARDTV